MSNAINTTRNGNTIRMSLVIAPKVFVDVDPDTNGKFGTYAELDGSPSPSMSKTFKTEKGAITAATKWLEARAASIAESALPTRA